MSDISEQKVLKKQKLTPDYAFSMRKMLHNAQVVKMGKIGHLLSDWWVALVSFARVVIDHSHVMNMDRNFRLSKSSKWPGF